MPIFKSKYPDIAIPPVTVPQLVFSSWTSKDEEKIAYIDGLNEEKKLTFGQVKAISYKIAKGLQQRGLKKGDVVAAVLANTIYYPSIFQGVLLAGGVISTANPTATNEELAKQLKDCKPTFVFTIAELLEKVKGQTTPADVTKRDTTTSGPPDPQRSDTPHATPIVTQPTITDKPTSEQIDNNQTDNNKYKQPNAPTTTDKPTTIENEQMYTTGNGKDEKSNTAHDTDEFDTSKKGKDSPGTKLLNFVEPASPPSSSSPDTIPSLPHAAFDEVEPPNSGPDRPKSGKEGETTIDVTDDEAGSSKKQIQTLGGGKKGWFACSVI